MMKLRMTVVEEREINLNGLEFKVWPKEAKMTAHAVLCLPAMREEFRRQLPGMRHSWLVAKVEARMQASREIEDEFGLRF
jgi:hypothetical protein